MTLLLTVIGWLMIGCVIAWLIGNASDLGGLSKNTFPDDTDAGAVAVEAPTRKTQNRRTRPLGFPSTIHTRVVV